ncbi:putative polysaccharide biosynthesis protein [Pontibacillus yanchengensis]|uniref:Cell division protein n=1 Tax=Pontibacillus yanchengensis Y32 TaxID=1385514 RepID=A0A0A2T6T8_9BACI|nr:polysaccharide biosynthesis protein [Pontibacillus yanchengensis]KGP71214.1 cell division protein [Pontibacillus yanchengensis Y32]
MAVSKILKGTMLLTGATFLSKFLGMIYTIPFNEMVGETGGALLYYAYTPYNILISVSTLGVPLAVSKFVSKYNAIGDYETGRKMYKSGLSLMAITGVIAFLLLYFSADLVAPWIKGDSQKGNSIEDIAMVIRMVSFALLIIPGMSLTRGFFQGYESMEPTAFSQVIEQIVRIAFLLTGTYIVMRYYNDMPLAVGFASFAAFIGAIASAIVLYVFWRRKKESLDEMLAQQQTSSNIPMKDLYKELLAYAGPFVLVGVATPIYQLVDMLTFNRAMSSAGLGSISEVSLSAMNLYGHKLVIIPVTLATGLSLALLPAITKSYTNGFQKQLFHQMNQSLQIIILIILPAAVGMSLLSNAAYATFYGFENMEITGPLLAWYAPVGLFFALFTVTSSILQGINKQRFAVVSLGTGLFLKITLNIPLILLFGAKGAIFGTGLAVVTAVILNLIKISRAAAFPLKQIIKRSMLMGILTIIMVLVVLIVRWILALLGLQFDDGRMAAVAVLFISAGTGAVVYLGLAYQTTLLERVLGNRIKVLDRFLKRS